MDELASFHDAMVSATERMATEIRSLEDQISIDLAEQEQRHAAEVAALRSQFQAKLKGLAELGKSAVFDPDEAAFLMMADDPTGELQKAYRERTQKVRARSEELARATRDRYAQLQTQRRSELAMAQTRAAAEWDAPAHRLAIVFCVGCGQVIGVTHLPADRADAERRLVEAIGGLAESMQALHSDLMTCLNAVVGRLRASESQVAAMKEREAAREQAARLRAAAGALQQLAGD